MKFQENNSYGKGRKRGSKNKNSSALKEIVKKILFEDTGSIADDLNSLEPFQRLQIKSKLFNLVMPNMKAIEVNDVTVEDNSIAARLEAYSDAELEAAVALHIKEELSNKNK